LETFKQTTVKKLHLVFLFFIVLVINSCSEEEPEAQIVNTDISVLKSQNEILWIDMSDLNNQINNSFTFNFGNARADQVLIEININADTTKVRANIKFKEEFSVDFIDTNTTNNSAEINLINDNSQETNNNDTLNEFYNPASVEYLESIDALVTNLPQFDLSNTPIYQVPIKFHDIHKSNGEGIVLNKSFIPILLKRLNEKFLEAKIEFVQCGSVNKINNSEWYNFPLVDYSGRQGVDFTYLENIMDNHNIKNVLNIYFPNTIEQAGGFYPGFEQVPHLESMLMVTKVNLELGLVMEHEIGHWLYLSHTHGRGNVDSTSDELVDGSNCENSGDNICDTPADPNLYRQISNDGFCIYRGNTMDANGDSYRPDTGNIMSYTTYECRNNFSPAQLRRMGVLLRSSLRNFINANNCENTEVSTISVSNDINFGNIQINSNSEIMTLRVSNTGDKSFDVFDITSSDSAFIIINGQSRTIEANSTFDFNIQFLPTEEKSFSSTITIENDADNANSENSSIQVTGRGIAEETDESIISLSGNLNFGEVEIGQTTSSNLIITNTGNSNLNVSSITVPDGFSASYNGTITPANTVNIEVIFTPTSTNTYDGALIVNSSAASGENSIQVNGIGINNNQNVNLSYSNHRVKDGNGAGVGNSDGIINAGEKIDLDVQIINNGNSTATNVSAVLTTNDSDITITDNFEEWADIPAGAAEWESDFDFDVSADTPTKTVTFNLQINSDQGSWNDSFVLDIQGQSDNSQPIDVGNNTPRDSCSATGSSDNYLLELNAVYFKQNWDIDNIISPGQDGLRGMWYRFRTTNSGNYNIGVNFGSGDAGFQLFSSCTSQSPIITANSSNQEGEVASVNLNANTDYYIRFYDIKDINPVNFIITITN